MGTQATYGALSRGHNHELPPIVMTDMQSIATQAAVRLHRDSLVTALHRKRSRSPEDNEVLRAAIAVLDDVDALLRGSRRAVPCRPSLTEKLGRPGAGNGRPQGDPANDS